MKRLFLSLLSCALLLPTLSAGVLSEKKTRLSDDWEFYRNEIPTLSDALGTADASSLSGPIKWEKVSLPHCFNASDAVDPYRPYYKGPGWYRTLLKTANPYTAGRTLLEFEGAGQKTRVYIGRQLVAEHVGGYDNWSVDITEAVKTCRQDAELQKKYKGEIPLTIRCDNSHDEEMIPSDLSDFNLYGGLYRPVNLVYQPEAYVQQIHVTPRLNASRRSATLDIEVQYAAPTGAAPGRQQLQITDPKGRVVFAHSFRPAADNTYRVSCTLNKNLALWDVENPQLYTCRLTGATGEATATTSVCFGLRQTRFADHGPFYLNGRRLLLHGTHRHEDMAGVGAAMTDGQIREEMLQMKAMGVNFIRLGHYQQNDLVLHLCDSLGILVWEESPWCRNYVTGEAMKSMTRRMLSTMINQHYNHPSVLVWGMGNEVDWLASKPYYRKDTVRAFLRELVELSHRLDPTRLTSLRRCDFAGDVLDVYSPSIWAGWYSGRFEQYKSMSEKYIEKTPHFLHVEWGGDSHAGRHSEDPFTCLGKKTAANAGDWSETYIVKLFDWTLKEQETMPNLTGAAFWTFRDFSTPLRPENPIPYVNQKGVVQRDGTPKESYYVFQSYWTRRPMVHIYGHTWPVRWGEKGEKKEILVYSNCSKVELFVNGQSQGIKTRRSQDFPAAGLHWSCPLKEGSNTIKAVARQDGKTYTDEITTEYQTKKWGSPARMTLVLNREKGDTCTAEVKFYDEKGVFCPDAKNFVEFGLTGDGRLLDNLGTTEGSRRIGAGNGRARIHFVCRGAAAVSAASKGLPTEVKTLP